MIKGETVMSKTRFQDTFNALKECNEHLNENIGDLSVDEKKARVKLLTECTDYVMLFRS
jgi:hypothetical protein